MELRFRTRGGLRRNAGRPGSRKGVSHAPRPHLAARHPVHVTLKVRPDLPTLRSRQTLRVFWRAACAAREKQSPARLVHYSVQDDHVHLLVEAPDRKALSRGIQGLAIRLARGINKELDRTGRVFADRYHARPLRTPLEVRRALAYVLLNARRHAAQRRLALPETFVDACTSAAYFDGFREGPFTWKRPHTTGPPVTPPRTWLLSTGWRRHGELSITEVPGSARDRALRGAAPG
jgi:REP element-mobilizing transposase RayT